ncbi:MAG TPA: SGNH/GDSL hydrolase family protein [Tepidisphaeraceae bacterium]|jgi:lysophospholipase L1-like esterase|nr:SGNH/GDSL hydrolase family protein [Tepidisphaeraceae bacterium]
MPISVSRETKILFIGDSITDCGRASDPDGIGVGYVRNIRDYLACKDPATAPHVTNTGISGHKVTDLAQRWQSDVLAHKPDVLSVKIGVNDVWHTLAGYGGVEIDRYIVTYREILGQVKERLPNCAIVLCEPSVIDPPQPSHANTELEPYIQAVHSLAVEFAVEAMVPLHEEFVRMRNLRPDILWTTDGVHPTSTGHMLIARTWLRATGLM